MIYKFIEKEITSNLTAIFAQVTGLPMILPVESSLCARKSRLKNIYILLYSIVI